MIRFVEAVMREHQDWIQFPSLVSVRIIFHRLQIRIHASEKLVPDPFFLIDLILKYFDISEPILFFCGK